MSTGSDDQHRLDELRLMALGRIPRCPACPLYRALASAMDGRPAVVGLPRPPRWCTHRVCKPLAARWSARLGEIKCAS